MRIAVLGMGAWGTALACVAARRCAEVVLWGRAADSVRRVRAERENRRYLGGVKIADNIVVTDDLDEALRDCSAAIVAVPTAAVRDLLARIRTIGWKGDLLYTCKGMERSSGLLAHEIGAKAGITQGVAVLGGPSFALEVARGEPTAVVVASEDTATADLFRGVIHGDSVRVYSSDDPLGVGLAGALKNVIAVAVGIGIGLGYGENSRAALITRGLYEMRKMVAAVGGKAETLFGLAGLGDLILTCSSRQSRNLRFGILLGEGQLHERALEQIGGVAEGYTAALGIADFALMHGVDMPICGQLERILSGKIAPREAIGELFARPLKSES